VFSCPNGQCCRATCLPTRSLTESGLSAVPRRVGKTWSVSECVGHPGSEHGDGVACEGCALFFVAFAVAAQ